MPWWGQVLTTRAVSPSPRSAWEEAQAGRPGRGGGGGLPLPPAAILHAHGRHSCSCAPPATHRTTPSLIGALDVSGVDAPGHVCDAMVPPASSTSFLPIQPAPQSCLLLLEEDPGHHAPHPNSIPPRSVLEAVAKVTCTDSLRTRRRPLLSGLLMLSPVPPPLGSSHHCNLLVLISWTHIHQEPC